MLKKFTYLCCLVFLLQTMGCANQPIGAKYTTDSERMDSLIAKKSSKRDVYYQIGQPVSVVYRDGQSVWKYSKLDSKKSAGSFIPFLNSFTMGDVWMVKEVEVFFDSNGISQSFIKNEKTVTTVLADFFDYDSRNLVQKVNSDVDKIRDEMKLHNLPFDEPSVREVLNTENMLAHQFYKDNLRKK